MTGGNPWSVARNPRDLTVPIRNGELSDVSGGADHEFAVPTRQIYVTTTGNLTFRLMGADGDITLAVTAGQIFSWSVTHVRRTSTAAVLGLW